MRQRLVVVGGNAAERPPPVFRAQHDHAVLDLAKESLSVGDIGGMILRYVRNAASLMSARRSRGQAARVP